MDDMLFFLTQYGTLVLFIVVLAEQIGLPVPAFAFLIAAGAFAATGQMTLGVTVSAAVLAALLGDQVWYELGRRRGRRVLHWLCRISFEPTSCVRRTEAFFARHGARALLVAKFIPGLSTIAPPLAGIVGLSMPQYLLYNGAGTLLWVASGIGVGYLFSGQLEQAVSAMAYVGPTTALVLLGIAAGYGISKRLHDRRAARLVPRLTVQQVRARISSGRSPLFVDLRPPGARGETPGIPGALLLSADELIATHRGLPRDRDLILYCACPQDAASVEAARRLRNAGVTRVWPLAGGIEAWHEVSAQGGPRSLRASDEIAVVV